jgi:electron transport complex protein RnfE
MLGENPIFLMVLGLCPALAVSTTVKKGLGMGVATALVLIGSSVLMPLAGRVVPRRAALLVSIGLAAGLATIVDVAMTAYMPGLRADLGIFVPLIAVNCIVLGRARAFALSRRPAASLVDGLGMGLGFTLVLGLVSAAREVIGSGTFWGLALFGPSFSPVLAVALAPGAFITLGLAAGVANLLKKRS